MKQNVQLQSSPLHLSALSPDQSFAASILLVKSFLPYYSTPNTDLMELSFRQFCFAITSLLVFSLWTSADAWSPHQKPFSYRQKDSTSSSIRRTPHRTVRRTMLRSPGTPFVRNNNNNRQRQSRLSNSVLASCDTLPAFPTAHGLLSPETVMRLEASENAAVSQFLRTYRSSGPLACVDLLSDPDVLPHLTRAMRDIA